MLIKNNWNRNKIRKKKNQFQKEWQRKDCRNCENYKELQKAIEKLDERVKTLEQGMLL